MLTSKRFSSLILLLSQKKMIFEVNGNDMRGKKLTFILNGVKISTFNNILWLAQSDTVNQIDGFKAIAIKENKWTLREKKGEKNK